jgi:hypothetical protein
MGLEGQTIVFNDPAHQALPMPGGGSVGTTDGAELTRRLIASGVPDAMHANGKNTNVIAYARFIGKLRNEAADKAVADWLAEHGGA